jgi:hypothetical protein
MAMVVTRRKHFKWREDPLLALFEDPAPYTLERNRAMLAST